MFTGLITDLGRVRAHDARGDHRFIIETAYDLATVDIGASIACSGCCLTVVEKLDGAFAVDVSAETLSKTTLGDWEEGRFVNLERSLKLGDELGGHIVSGHVDGVGRITRIAPVGDSHRVTIEMPPNVPPFVAQKGSIAVDGVSLTVNEVEGDSFGVNIIPHTWEVTAFGTAKEGQAVNLEIDLFARYVARLLEKRDQNV